MSSKSVLMPLDERRVEFYEDEVTAALVKVDGQKRVYVPLRPICDYLQINWSGQRQRLNRDPVLSEESRFVCVTHTNLGGNPNMLCLPLEFLNGWLFGIDASRVKSELREKVIRYQRECYRILWQAFQAEAMATTESIEMTTSVDIVALEQIRDMGLAIARMAEQQIEMEQRLSARLDRASVVVGDIQRRLRVVEGKLHPAILITDEQTEEVSASVKALAELITMRDSSKNHYQSIFAELYRRFGVSSYKNIRAGQYEAVLQFLEDWRQSFLVEK